MIRGYDDLLKLNEKKLYLYGAKNVALEIKGFFERNGIPFCGYIVSKPENNKNEIDGKPVKALADMKDELSDISVLVACAPNFKKDIGNALFAAGARRVFFLDNQFAWVLQTQAKSKKAFNDFAANYEMVFPAALEWGQGVIRQKNADSSFRLRTELGQLWNLTQFSDKSLFNGGRLQWEFETLWTKFADIKELPRAKAESAVKDSFDVYSIKCHLDRVACNLKSEDYISEIQAGAAIAPSKVCSLTDDTGQNISDRNKDFSECSAIYWVWKNRGDKDYTGCFHYRRHLDIAEDDLLAAKSSGVDLINTIPCLVYPNIRKFFADSFLFDKDLELALEGVEKLHPEYLRSVLHVLDGHYYLANNIMIMKTTWFNRMCQFVFDVLLYVDNHYRAEGLVKEDRYAGYIFELLYSVFVFHHAKEMKIAFADMNAKVAN